MLNFSVDLDKERICRYAFEVKLWEHRKNKYGMPITVMVDTGSFNTIIHDKLVDFYGVRLKIAMPISIGGYKGEAPICILHKISIGGHVLENVAALAVPFKGELKDHILLGANVTNNWKLTLSRYENKIDVTEQFSEIALQRTYPYQYYFNNKGGIMAVQEWK